MTLALSTPLSAEPPPRSNGLRRGETGRTASFLGAALVGTTEDLDGLLGHIRPRVVLWAATRLSGDLAGKVEAEDIAQLVLMSVHNDFDRFSGSSRGELLAWVFAIAENRIRDVFRHFAAQKRSRGGAAGESVAPLPEHLASAQAFHQRQRTTPSQAIVRDEALGGMREALSGLGPRFQAVIRMRDLEMRPYQEVVEALELESVGAARTLRCRALIALRRAMKAKVS